MRALTLGIAVLMVVCSGRAAAGVLNGCLNVGTGIIRILPSILPPPLDNSCNLNAASARQREVPISLDDAAQVADLQNQLQALQAKQNVIRQQDTIAAFDVATGRGFQTGTATGPVSGTTFVAFQYTIGALGPDGAFAVSFHNKVTITDIDGDQVFYDNDGTGEFHVGVPGDAFAGTGGPMTGTYVLTKGTGKYSSLPVGTQLLYKAVLANPPNGALGTVYVELTPP